MYIKCAAYFATFYLLSSFGWTIALKNRDHAGNVANLREAVSNAFDALTEVQQAIPKYDVIDEESIDFGDVAMDKNTAEKFVEEIDQLEDMILNKEHDVMDSIRKKKSEEDSERNIRLSEKRNKDIDIKNIVKKRDKDFHMKDMLTKRSKELDIKEMLKKRSQDFDMKEMRGFQRDDSKQLGRSFDALLAILKKSVDEKDRRTNFEDFLLANYLNEAQMRNDKKELKAVAGTKKEVRKVDVRTALKKTTKVQTKKEVKKCTGTKKECANNEEIKSSDKKISEKKETKEDKKTERFNKDIKSSPLKKKSVKSNPTTVNHSSKSKRPSWSKKQSLADENYDKEIKDLVGAILKRREETKREKLKLVLSDIFHVLDNKRTNTQQ